jgi:BolA protein
MTLRTSIESKLRAALTPSRLEIHDDSAAHAGHGAGGAHVRIVIVSAAFIGRTSLQRHRMVNAALAEELGDNTIHALQISAKAPGE